MSLTHTNGAESHWLLDDLKIVRETALVHKALESRGDFMIPESDQSASRRIAKEHQK
jgi:hypothetical protein